MFLNHLITTCNPPACSNITIHHKTNSQITSIEFYKYLNHIKYYSSHLTNNYHLHFQEMKNTLNMYLNHLVTLCKAPACSNTTNHHKTNFQRHKYRVLQVFILERILFITSNEKYSFIFTRNEKTSNMYLKHLITSCKPLACSNTTNHHKTNFKYYKYRVLQVFK